MVNGVWGYQVGARDWNSADEVRAMLKAANEKGANLLLNIGPQADGRLPRPAMELLRALAIPSAQ